MVETGGPTTQAGIFYQNTIAALYLGRMLDLRPRSAKDRVLQVRVEAPEEVDDIVVRLGDGSRRFIQAKRAIAIPSDAWDGLWQAFWRQLHVPAFKLEDRLVLTVGESSPKTNDLRACCERTTSTVNDDEYQKRLTEPQRNVISSIQNALAEYGCDARCVRDLLARVDVEFMQDTSIERDLAPLWMPESSATSQQLLGLFRDMAGGAARVRRSFDPPTLRARLKDEHGIEVTEPGGWGAAHYRTIVSGKAVIEVPGTGFVKPIEDLYLWPRANRYDRSHHPDFDDETPRSVIGIQSDSVDLSLFPSTGLGHLVVVAGPGFGKTVLSLALAASTVKRGLLPAIIPIPDLSRIDVGIGDYLRDYLNKSCEVNIDWTVAADSGLLVLLLDGLDEVSSDRRAVMLDRIKTFALRHPGTHWLLTVRDAAALAAPTPSALFVELEALRWDDIRRFIELYRPDDPDLPGRLFRCFAARPDLERLVRIPFFLAIFLASTVEANELPSKRTELLELYLALLFSPEQVKRGEADGVDPSVLRPIAEIVAFEALEREEIGVGGRLLEATLRRQLNSGTPLQPIIDRLVKCGVLRRINPVSYAFPFPIVQEYLAACHLLADRLDQVQGWLSLAVKRPWAQALQFVLELHPNPNNLIEDLLAQEDDTFSTNLRLVARCITNGMVVKPAAKAEIARRLAGIWPHSGSRMQLRIGTLISDSFCVPLEPEVRVQLSNRSLLHHGAGAVVARINNPDLTRAVLTELLEGDIEHLSLGELRGPVSALGDQAIEIYARRAALADGPDNERSAIASLIHQLDGSLISECARLTVALDQSLPVAVRLAAFALGPPPIDARALPLIECAIVMDSFYPRYLAMKAIAKLADPLDTIRSTLVRPDLILEEKINLVGYVHDALRDSAADLLKYLSRDTTIDIDLRRYLLVFAAGDGDAAAMSDLVACAGDLPVVIVGATLSIIGHHRLRSLAETAAYQLRNRVLQPGERVTLAGDAVLGMTTLFEMNWFRGGAVRPALPHPGVEAFRALLETWVAMRDYLPLEALQIAVAFAQLGSEPALALIEERLKQAVSDDNVDLQDFDQAHTIGNAIRTLQDRQYLLSLSFLESVIARFSYNAALTAVEMIAVRGSGEAFESLMGIYDRTADGFLRSAILDSLETLAGRLGFRLRTSGARLEAASA
jgi:hypothetical protein